MSFTKPEGKPPIIFMDIDNTMAARDTETSDEQKLFAQCAPTTPAVEEAVRRAAAKGAIIMLCTGRPRCGIVQQVLDLPISGMVCCSGAWAEVGGKVVREEWLSEDLLAELVGHIERNGSFALMESNDLVSIYETRAEVEHAIPCARSLDELRELNPGMRVTKLIVPDDLALVLKEDEGLAGRVTVFDAAGGANEVTLPSINKRAGIEAILAELGDASHGTVYGIGDSENDASLLDAVDVAIAMGSAPESIKEKAGFVAPDVWHDGVVDALAHFGLA